MIVARWGDYASLRQLDDLLRVECCGPARCLTLRSATIFHLDLHGSWMTGGRLSRLFTVDRDINL